jgi:rubrerythrin
MLENMDFLDYAKEIETLGMEQYALLSYKTHTRELSSIFVFLADQEKRHYEIFDSWQRKGPPPEVPAETVLGKAKEAFRRMAGHFMTNNYLPPLNYEQAYEKALLFENKSIALYEEALPKVEDREQRSVLERIIGQEKAHSRFITSLMEFLRHPGEWLENAEWNHLEEF